MHTEFLSQGIRFSLIVSRDALQRKDPVIRPTGDLSPNFYKKIGLSKHRAKRRGSKTTGPRRRWQL